MIQPLSYIVLVLAMCWLIATALLEINMLALGISDIFSLSKHKHLYILKTAKEICLSGIVVSTCIMISKFFHDIYTDDEKSTNLKKESEK